MYFTYLVHMIELNMLNRLSHVENAYKKLLKYLLSRLAFFFPISKSTSLSSHAHLNLFFFSHCLMFSQYPLDLFEYPMFSVKVGMINSCKLGLLVVLLPVGVCWLLCYPPHRSAILSLFSSSDSFSEVPRHG